ncbi:MAG: thymidine phosphorylase [Pseudomonadota bacterium]
MDPRRTIARLRDREHVSPDELAEFIHGIGDGRIGDAQAAAFAMAIVLNGVSHDQRVALTLAMRDSGDVLNWDLPGPVLDKHSTGGVGDSVSLILAPALAACGAYVPMISGRGLGHTGGTLDKLEAIPGVVTEVSEPDFRRIVGDVGCAIVSATGSIAPADKRLYAVRDLTATVESVDLITASILSKKLAAGLDALVLDVKVGSGAFMKSHAEAKTLAQALVSAARGAGCPTQALITDMNQPLAPALGNALEVAGVMEILTRGVPVDGVPDPLLTLVAELGGTALALGGLADNAASGARLILDAVEMGHAAEKFGAMVTALGGPADFVSRWMDRLPSAPVLVDVLADRSGYVGTIDGTGLGHVVIDLGGGRKFDGDAIDPTVGLSAVAALGSRVAVGDRLAVVHAVSETEALEAAQAVVGAFSIVPDRPSVPGRIHERIGA